MTVDDEIRKLMKVGKQFLDNQEFDKAKKSFLDAAELAVQESKTNSSKKSSYQKIAKMLIDWAKDTDIQEDLIEQQNQIKSIQKESSFDDDFPTVPKHISKKIESIDKALAKGADSIISDTKPKKADEGKIPKIISDFEIQAPRKPINVPVGTVIKGELIDTIYQWHPKTLMNGIMMCTGGSGSGKTEWLKSLIIELVDRGFPTLVLDLHGDIETPIPAISIDYVGKFGINPLELISKRPEDGGPVPQVNRLLQMFDDAIEDRFSPIQKAYLHDVLSAAYQEAGILQSDSKTWELPVPKFKRVLEILSTGKITSPLVSAQYKKGIGNVGQSTKSATKNRLIHILQHPAFASKQTIPLDVLLEKPLRINLKSLQTIEMQFIVADTILRHLFAKIKSLGHVNGDTDTDKFRLFVIIDEVKILTGNRGDVSDTYHILNRLATESRKFGLGLVLASQVIRHFGRDVRANSASKLILRPMDAQEAKQNGKEIQVDHKEIMDIDRPGLGYLITTELDEALKIQLFPATNRPYDLSPSSDDDIDEHLLT